MTNQRTELKQFKARPLWYTLRGIVMILSGGGIAVLCLMAPNVYMLGDNLSWLPAVSALLLLVGILRCSDAYSAHSAPGFLVNMQGGVLDVVTGGLLLLNIGEDAAKLQLLLVGYMVAQGIYRNILLSVAKVPHPVANRITGFISIGLGVLIWSELPTVAPWFLALSLSVDVAFRGWLLVVLAASLKKQTSEV